MEVKFWLRHDKGELVEEVLELPDGYRVEEVEEDLIRWCRKLTLWWVKTGTLSYGFQTLTSPIRIRSRQKRCA